VIKRPPTKGAEWRTASNASKLCQGRWSGLVAVFRQKLRSISAWQEPIKSNRFSLDGIDRSHSVFSILPGHVALGHYGEALKYNFRYPNNSQASHARVILNIHLRYLGGYWFGY
jgi:hypothetical protein